MRLNKKITFAIIFSLFAVSLFSSIPTGLAASVDSKIGHNFEEKYWSILYDFAGEYLEEDYNSGPLNGSVSEGLTDNNTAIDSKFFISWSNIQNVQSLYIALQNFTWDVANTSISLYGCAPYQVLIQHFRPPGQLQIHIFVINTFLGLLAYREMPWDPIKDDIPDENDSLYMGWSYYSEYHKFLANLVFAYNSVPQYLWFDNTTKGTATPIPMTETANDTFKYGMSYKDIFILWQRINITQSLDNSVTHAEIINRCSAFAHLSEINFTYVVSYKDSTTEPGFREVTTTTEYDIGNITDLWVVGDNETVTNYFGGENFTLTWPTNVSIGYYNESDVVDRIDGNETYGIPGFGLSVLNHANVVIMNLSNWQHGFEYTGPTDFVDATNNTLGASSKNITEASYDFMDNPAFKIDFASKPTYLLNGVDEYPAPTVVLRNEAFKFPLGFLHKLHVRAVLAGFIANMTGSAFAGLIAFFTPFLDSAKFFYMTCFPIWSGGTISQDPTFTAFVPISEDVDGDTRIPGYEPLILSLIGLSGISLILLRIKKKKKLIVS